VFPAHFWRANLKNLSFFLSDSGSAISKARNEAARKGCFGSGFDVDFQFLGETMRIKGAAGEIPARNFNRWNFAPAIVGAKYDVFCVRRLVNVHFAKSDSPLSQEPLRAPAIRTPNRTIDGNFDHFELITLRTVARIGSSSS
jgi:hypothetical protein